MSLSRNISFLSSLLSLFLDPIMAGTVPSVIDLKGGSAEEVMDVKLGYAHPQ